jgi:uncharacterized membrane protein
MKQILHIFTKDARRFWPEILISLAITAAYICIGPHLWISATDDRSRLLTNLAGLLVVLLPVSWWILISRVIHAEKLVGDTQFWITRPYTWKKLLTAKMLFIATFVVLPFFAAQIILLAEGGFPPQLLLPGLLYNLLLVSVLFMLPLIALSTITSSFARLTLTILGIFLCFIALVALLAFASQNHQVGTMNQPLTRGICFALVVLALAAAIVVQYALRKVWLARTVLLTLTLLLCLVSFIAPDKYLVNRNYPLMAANQAAPVQLTYHPDFHSIGTAFYQASSRMMIQVNAPLTESNTAEGVALIPDGIRAEITASDGSHWKSEWQSTSSGPILPGGVSPLVKFSIPLAELRKFQSKQLHLHLSLAYSQAQAEPARTFTFSKGSFTVPDFGICSPQMGWSATGDATGINCISPLRKPPLTYIATRWTDSSCSANAAAPGLSVTGAAWTGELDRAPAGFNLSPVAKPDIGLSNADNGSENRKPRFLCPGTPVTFTTFKLVRRTQTTFDIQDFHLPKTTVIGNQISIDQIG